MKLCLNMIVKNEAQMLPRLFASLYKYINFYVICDTGSQDNTIEVIEQLGRRYGIKGVVIKESWKNFAYNRNVALDYAIRLYKEGLMDSSWLLIIDADEELIVKNEDFLSSLNKEVSYCLYKNYNEECFNVLSILSLEQVGWRWRGEIHNYLVNERTKQKSGFLRDVEIKYTLFEGAKSHPFQTILQKHKADAALMKKELEGTKPTKDNIHRFYQLANALTGSNDPLKASECFSMVAESQFSIGDLRYTSLINMGKIALNTLNRPNAAKEIFQEALIADPDREEALYYLARVYQQLGDKEKAEELLLKADSADPGNRIFYDKDFNISLWRIKFQLLTIYLAQKRSEDVRTIVSQLEKIDKLPYEFRAILKKLMITSIMAK